MNPILTIASWLITKSRTTTRNRSQATDLENGFLLGDTEVRLSQAKKGLLEAMEVDNRAPYSEWYFAYLDQKFQSLNDRLKAVLATRDGKKEPMESEAAVRFYELLAIVATALRTFEELPSMDEIKGSIPTHLAAKDNDTELLQLIFIMMGFLTMLYDPDLDPGPHEVSIAKPLSLSGTSLATDLITSYHYDLDDTSQLQAHELLKKFGPIIPGSVDWACETPAGHQPDIFIEQLGLSNLNFYTLFKIGKIKVELVDSLGLHMEFEAKTRTLKLFRFPSYCALVCSSNIEGRYWCLSQLYHQYYFRRESRFLGFHMMEVMTPRTLAEEVILSYRLLFSQHSKSRSMFKKIRCKFPGFARRFDADPCLEKLCSLTCSAPLYAEIGAPPPAEQYAARKEFPLLGQRLVILQEFILNQSPSDWDGLRHDRRDILRYYTFWAVVYVGGVSIILSAIQAILTLVQLILASTK